MKESAAGKITPQVEDFMRWALDIVGEMGSSSQKDDIYDYVSFLSKFHRELVDVENGAKNTWQVVHHPAEKLRVGSLRSALRIIGVIAEIKGYPVKD